jgi:hypothetical protein
MKMGTDGYPRTHRITPQNPKLRAQRRPMLLFVFEGLLFKFIVNTPALELLFQLPPRRKPRTALLPQTTYLKLNDLSSFDKTLTPPPAAQDALDFSQEQGSMFVFCFRQEVKVSRKSQVSSINGISNLDFPL